MKHCEGAKEPTVVMELTVHACSMESGYNLMCFKKKKLVESLVEYMFERFVLSVGLDEDTRKGDHVMRSKLGRI